MDEIEFSGSIQARIADIPLSTLQLSQLYTHFRLLLAWNEKINLTAVRRPEEIVSRHYCESLFFAATIPEQVESVSVADIGSGAGFPGFPIAVLKPHWRVTLVESHQRKAVFLREACRALNNLSVESQRADQLAGSYDWVCTRAVRPDEVLGLLPRLAPKVGLLLSDSDYAGLRNSWPSFVWRGSIPVPWANHLVCGFGSISE